MNQFEIQSQSQMTESKQGSSRQPALKPKKEYRSATMTNSFAQSQYPFAVIEEENKSAYGRDDVKRVSMSVHSHVSSDSFVSAPDSPSAQKRLMLEQKLRMKKQK